MLCSLSKLDDSQLGQIESLEKELGKTLLSFTCHDIKPAELKGDELEKIKNLEKKPHKNSDIKRIHQGCML